MAKKSRKPNLPQEALERARRELAQQTGEVIEVSQAPAATAAESAPKPAVKKYKPVDLSSEYAYVIADLRNMAVLAAIMMFVLVVLSFVI